MWGSLFMECLSLGWKPHSPQPSQICLSKDIGSLDIFVPLVIPSGYPIIWLGYSNKKIAVYPFFMENMVFWEVYRPISDSCLLSSAE